MMNKINLRLGSVQGILITRLKCLLWFLVTFMAVHPCAALSNQDFLIGTHYYGLAEYSWPVNYLNAIKESDVESDLKKLKELGFNSIVLLASWSEFQPKIGESDKDAYRKINLIIRVAKKLNLKVLIRIPYLWSLIGQEKRERIAYALIDYGTYRADLLDFLKEFSTGVIQIHDNIVMKFGSWEDYYVLRDLFFSNGSVVSERVRQAFFRDTGIEASKVIQNGENYNHFLNWIDSRIQQFSKEVGNYGYEIRTDADPFTNGKEMLWYSHSEYYKNESNGSLIAYWAPFYGQQNKGETISAEQAIKSFTWMLDSIASKSPQLPFIDQLNFYDNSPGAERNAKLSEDAYSTFFEMLAPILADRTAGYALWTVRDYSHNYIFNPAFSEGLKGWVGKGVNASSSGVSIAQDGYLAQLIVDRNYFEKVENLVINIISGAAEIELDPVGDFRLEGAGRHEIKMPSPTYISKITVRPIGKGNLHIQDIGLFSHTQIGRVFNQSGTQGDFYKLIQRFNSVLSKEADKECRGFNNILSSGVYFARGVYPDGWSSPQFELCFPRDNSASGFRLLYANPSPQKRVAEISTSMSKSTLNLGGGDAEIRVCAPHGKQIDRMSISVSSSFIPNAQNPQSPDIRNLGIFIKEIHPLECQKEGIWQR